MIQELAENKYIRTARLATAITSLVKPLEMRMRARTGMEQNIICDAGDLLWTLTSSGVNLVFCGHRHRPWIWELGNLPVIHAGTVSTPSWQIK